ncbi:MAG: YceI family protein [Lysobacteraceae bacterium]
MRSPFLALSALLLFTTMFAQAKPDHYELEPIHSRIVFTCNHFGYSNVIGTFSRPVGTLEFDPDDWASAKLDVSVKLATLDLGDAKFNQRILKRDYLDAKKHPVARFISTRIEPLTPTTAKVHGELTLRGTTKPLTLEVNLNKLARNRYTMRRTAGFSARATLDRNDWGMDDDPGVVGATVELVIEAEAVRARTTQ